MCPEECSPPDEDEFLEQFGALLATGTRQRLELVEYVEDLSQEGLSAAYINKLPALALCLRLQLDPTVTSWVSELRAMPEEERAKAAGDLAMGAPRGIGRRVITDLLIAGAEGSIVGQAAYAAIIGGAAQSADPKRAPKAGEHHHKIQGLVDAADRIVRRLVAFPAPIEPVSDADRRAELRLLGEVGAAVLGDGSRSPVAQRRLSG